MSIAPKLTVFVVSVRAKAANFLPPNSQVLFTPKHTQKPGGFGATGIALEGY